jgi:hypothetical protein
MAEVKTIVLMSDLHCGSWSGLCPPGCYRGDGVEFALNKLQEWLWHCWQESLKRFLSFVGDDPWALVINGDVVEGIHHRTTEVVTVDPREHLLLCTHAVSPWATRATKMYIVRGTESHVATMENSLGEHFQAEPDPATKAHCWEHLYLEVNGCLCHFQHHVPAAMREHTKSSQFGIQMDNERARCAKRGHGVPRVMCRAHRHQFGLYGDGYGYFIITPSWQGVTKYGRKVSHEHISEVGLVVLDWRNRDNGALPEVIWEPWFWKPPQDPIIGA